MKTFTAKELKTILENHRKWLYENSGQKANLSGADLSGADLFGADLSRANLSGVNLSRAKLSGADLSGANLSRADLSGANLHGANLRGANLSVANLSRANLFGADLSGANLHGANLSGANLSGVNLSGANLFGVKSNFSILVSLTGMKYSVLLKDDLVKIGCQEHKYSKWKSFSDTEIEKMDSGALDFYYAIIPVLDMYYKNTQWEIK